jgi:biopolymer transport protein TolR
MAMLSSHRPGEINVTPMIDVLLVLLVIFMVIQPQRSIGLDTDIPQPAASAAAPANDVTIAVRSDGTIRVNQEPVAASTLEARLRDLYKRAADLTVFIRADPDVDFAQVAEVIDTANGIGIKKVGLLPR